MAQTPQIKRLRTLYAMMAGIPDFGLNMGAWRSTKIGGDGWSRSNHVTDADLLALAENQAHTCGTSACMLGWAAAYPPFKALGLKYEDTDVCFRGAREYRAGANFFGLSFNDAMDLFYPVSSSGYTQKQVAMRRIRRLLLKFGAISQDRNREIALEDGGAE